MQERRGFLNTAAAHFCRWEDLVAFEHYLLVLPVVLTFLAGQFLVLALSSLLGVASPLPMGLGRARWHLFSSRQLIFIFGGAKLQCFCCG